MATKNADTIRDHVRAEVKRRMVERGRIDNTDVEIFADGEELVIRGSVDDAVAQGIIERVALEIGGSAIRSELGIRDDIGAEAAAKETEFGSEAASRATTGRPALPS
jgi:hypothetical protein